MDEHERIERRTAATRRDGEDTGCLTVPSKTSLVSLVTQEVSARPTTRLPTPRLRLLPSSKGLDRATKRVSRGGIRLVARTQGLLRGKNAERAIGVRDDAVAPGSLLHPKCWYAKLSPESL